MSQAILQANTDCGCGSWACEICFSDDVPVVPVKEPVQTANSWNKPLPYVTVSQPLVEALEGGETSDNWDGFTVVSSKKRYRSKGGAGMKPVEIRCKNEDCGKCFIYTVEQQQKYRARRWKQPKICKTCAQKRHYIKA